ncbi:hypothetical protein [Bradyrhizobium diazoefficiens]|uniref:hypothetical protein n=1 Tax=Bradyrhizobium diazoefficiens TaxID=1355477 RepID=UPI003836B955
MPDTAEPIDYEFWSRMSGWSVSEAAALFLDIDPDRIPEESSDPEHPGSKYRRLFRLLDRAREMEELEPLTVPRDLLAWASSNGIKPSVELTTKVRAGKPHRNWRTRYKAIREERDKLVLELEALKAELSDDVAPRAKTTLLKLVGGMARAKFGHASNVRGTAKKIEDALDHPSVHWHLANNAIKGWLDAADALYDEEHPKNSNEI